METKEILSNLAQEINPVLRYVEYTNLNGKSWNNSLNRITNNTMYYICDGEGVITSNGINYFPKQNDFVLLPVNQYIASKSINDNKYIKYWCVFASTIGSTDIFNILSTPLCVKAKQPKKVKQIFENLLMNFHVWPQNIISQMHIKSCLMQLICLYLESCAESEIKLINNNSNNVMHNVLLYIENNISNHISINELAQRFHFNPYYFISLFKSNFGVTPIQYINALKINRAKHDILFTQESISEIADKFGISYKNFVVLFKKHYGISPSAMRKNRDVNKYN